MEKSTEAPIPVDFIKMAFEMCRFHICSLDFPIRQNTNRILTIIVSCRLAFRDRGVRELQYKKWLWNHVLGSWTNFNSTRRFS